MKIFQKKMIFLLVLLFVLSALSARSLGSQGADKKLDLIKYHDVGNIWLRVSNYGFFGSGDDITPQWPSLEYPGGSAIDYLYQGALWFGAKKIRRNEFGQKLYWLPNAHSKDDVVAEGDILNGWTADLPIVLDTLVTEGFDGDADLYEFLPAYNPLETSALGTQYSIYNPSDTILSASIRTQRKGVDDDGDGRIDEDPAGYSFPFRPALDDDGSPILPPVFADYGGLFPADFADYSAIDENYDIWFPLGFVDLADTTNTLYNFAMPTNDDAEAVNGFPADNLTDEDGYPVSEQDYIGYYYDYSPFGTPGQRDSGGSKSSNTHVPLDVRVRQMSYQWSYDYIKNMVYIEFDITNMNKRDTLYDCVMGIYMDSDVGPQAYGAQARADDDVSSYNKEGGEYAYTYDADHDNGLTPGYVGSRVCTPNPDSLEFACWTWKVGDGPDDSDVQTPGNRNEKYALLKGANPNSDKYTSLRENPHTQDDNPVDTRYLFAFYGDQNGFEEPTENSWNLAPGKTMKIVIAIFPGMSEIELSKSANNAKDIYGTPQELNTVVLPDIYPHYQPKEPPRIPKTYVELSNNGNTINVYWDNISQMDNVDVSNISKDLIGWQNQYPDKDSYIGNYDEDTFPAEFAPNDNNMNLGAIVNPWTGYRLRHDFEGYTLYGRSGSGSQEDWMMIHKWDKVNTEKDYEDYAVASPDYNFGAYMDDYGHDTGFPQGRELTDADNFYFDYYRLSDDFALVNYQAGDMIYGEPIYNTLTSQDAEALAGGLSFDEQSLLFKNPNIGDNVYLALYDDKLIPLLGHGGEHNVENGVEDEKYRQERLSRFFYKGEINSPPKGVEYYIAVTAFDRGAPDSSLPPQESGRDADANMKVIFPGPSAKSSMDNIIVIPNPYIARSSFDGRRASDEKGDKSRRLWFANIPANCSISIYTLAGDLVDTVEHNAQTTEDIISISKAATYGIPASGIASWDLLSRNNQIIAPGIYLFSVKNNDNNEIKVGKFVIIK